MNINEIIIPFEIEEKLLLKHDVESFEVEEIFENFPLSDILKKVKPKVKICIWHGDKHLMDDIC